MTTMTDARAVEVLAAMREDGGVVDDADYTAAIDHAIARMGEPAEAQPDPSFAEWLATEMPAGTVIGDPAWWANRIARQYAKRRSPAEAQGGGEVVGYASPEELDRARRHNDVPVLGRAQAGSVPVVAAPPSAPVGVGGLDLELIAEMLEAYEQHTRCGLDLAHVESSILEQAALLRETSERDAAGVHTALAQQPAAVDGAMAGWIADGDTIPDYLIEATRDAIRQEFGNTGTDGYYRRILVRVFRALAAQPGGSDNG